MSQPTVVCVMLANGRQEMVNRAYASFLSQTYEPKRLVIYDSGRPFLSGMGWEMLPKDGPIYWVPVVDSAPTIGELRNCANEYAVKWAGADIMAHWDSDDWSHPARMAEQVEFLQDTESHAVGYREMLFWETVREGWGEAWLYRHPSPAYCLGSSLCYWSSAWQAKPFPHTSRGEDTRWLMGLETAGVDSRASRTIANLIGQKAGDATLKEPRMICSIHGGNTCSRIDPAAVEWKRAAGWDQHCRRIMEGK